jgi:acyl-CoA synthetase (AMP-forming)/AMP-acid ligase II
MSKTSLQNKRKRPVTQAVTGTDALLNAWEKTRRENANRGAIFDGLGNVVSSFGRIEERAVEFVRRLESFSSGEVIAIQIGNHPDWPSLFLACLRKQLVVLPLEQTISEEQRKAAFETCGVVAVAVPGSRGVRVECPCRRGRTAATTIRALLGRWGKHQPSLLKLTSGTTAAPRAVRFRSEQLLADCENICDAMGITARDLNFGVIPISHSYGFSNLLTPLLARGVALALSNDRIPRAILDGIAASGATVFPGMPVFYQSFCELNNPPSLPKLRLCISAGAPLSTTISGNFREKFGGAIHSFYGSSECGGICYVREPNATPGFVGPAMRGVKIDLLDSRDKPAHGRASVPASRIRVRSRAVGDGYFPEPDEAKLGRGVFLPDDLLEKTPDGYRIVGRVSDLINVAGKKVSPAQVEAELLRYENVSEAIVFARESTRRNEEVVACVVATGTITEIELLAYCRTRLSSWQTPRRIFLISRMPVNERGKISRRELAQLYANGNSRSA